MAEKADELKTREEKIAQAKELYSRGSRNYLVKSYNEAADDLSQVCSLYEELYGTLCDELGMPYLLYAKSLLALEEIKIVDVPDEEDDDEDAEEVEANGENNEIVDSTLPTIPEDVSEENLKEKDEPASKENSEAEPVKEKSVEGKAEEKESDDTIDAEKNDGKKNAIEGENIETEKKEASTTDQPIKSTATDDAKPGTSNGNTAPDEDTNEEVDDGNEATDYQVAWETLELAAKIFERQGESALPNLAEVKTELANIQFENNCLDSARGDYNDALNIYKKLPSNYRRAMAEIHYKIGLSYLMQEQQSYKESAESFKKACELLDEEIKEIKSKTDLADKDKAIEDMEETRQEIWAKITEIEESRQQRLADVRAALDNYISPSKDPEIAGPSSSSSVEKPAKDISHLIKRKKPDSSNDAEASPAKRPTL